LLLIAAVIYDAYVSRMSRRNNSRRSSNQAMQRTAGRSAFPLAVTSTFNLQPRTLSPAVADLGSR
jgi:hypothetical protein